MQSRLRRLIAAGMPGKDASIPAPVLIAVVLALSIGFLDLAVDIWAGQTKGVPANFILMSLAVTTGVFFVCDLAVWFLFARPFGKFFRLNQASLCISVALFIGTAFLFGSLHGLITFSASKIDPAKLFLVLSFSVVFSALAFFAVKGISDKPVYSDAALRAGLSVPFLVAEFAVISALSFSSPIGIIIFLFSAAATVFLFSRTSTQTKPRLLVGVFSVILIVAPLSGAANYDNTPVREPFRLSEHRIKRVILITVDTLREDFVSTYNKRSPRTPHLDGLADDGLVFTNAISPAPWTLPALSSLMTGLSPDVHLTKTPTSILPDKLQTLAGYMRENGYLTGAIVFNPYLKLSHGLSQGFMQYDVYPRTMIGNSFGAKLLKKIFPAQLREVVTTDELTDSAIAWLKSNQDKDFFLWVHYLDPHMPYAPPGEFLPRGKAPASMDTRFETSSSTIRDGHVTLTLEQRDWVKKLYNGEVLYVDKSLGRLLDWLKRAEIYENSLIILTADHGEEFWEHGSFEHGHSLYNELLRVPLIIKLPSSSPKGRITVRVQTHSVLPTVLDLCGIRYAAERLSAGSLFPLWSTDRRAADARPIVSSSLLYYEDREALFYNDLKYITYRMTNREELYDLSKDPGELSDIANANPAIIGRAREIMNRYHARSKELRDYYQIEKGTEIELDQKTVQELKSLGYIK